MKRGMQLHNITELTKLINEIENAKVRLDNLLFIKQYNLLDDEVIKLSQQLDNLLSQYYILK